MANWTGRSRGRGRGFGRGRGRSHCADTGQCTLDRVSSGDELEVLEVNDDSARMHALRFGMAEGSRVGCVTTIPAGPVILRSGRQEIAVGRALARRINVRHVHSGDGEAV